MALRMKIDLMVSSINARTLVHGIVLFSHLYHSALFNDFL